MRPDTQLDFAVFQLSPNQDRYCSYIIFFNLNTRKNSTPLLQHILQQLNISLSKLTSTFQSFHISLSLNYYLSVAKKAKLLLNGLLCHFGKFVCSVRICSWMVCRCSLGLCHYSKNENILLHWLYNWSSRFLVYYCLNSH